MDVHGGERLAGPWSFQDSVFSDLKSSTQTLNTWNDSLGGHFAPAPLTYYSLKGLMLKLRLQYLAQLMRITDSLEKTLMLGKIKGWREKGMTKYEMVGWHHQLNEHEFEQALGDSEGQGSLACCSPWGLSQTRLRG